VRRRLVVALVGVVAVVLLAVAVPLFFHLEKVERDRLETTLERDAYVIAGRSEDVLEGTVTTADAGIDRVVGGYANRTGATVVVTDADGTAIAVSGDGESVGDDYTNRPEVAAAVQGRFASGERASRTLGERLVYVAVPVRSGGDVLGAVRISYPARVIDDRVSDRLRGPLAAGAVAIAVALVVAWAVAATVTRPLRRLRATTESLAAGDLTTRTAAATGPPEVRALASSLDTMAARLEDLVATQRSFAADASHQLRTPLTALRLRIDQAAALVATDPAAAARRLDAAVREVERLSRLTEGLLALARIEGADASVGEVDVAALALERAEQWRPLADEGRISLEVEAPQTARAQALEGAVEQIADCYIANALDVAPAGSTVRVVVEVGATDVTLHVQDDGPGLTEHQRAHAFDRFWQGPGAEAGSGLGLAIARQLATAGGGTAELRAVPGGGVDAVARFTAAADPAERAVTDPAASAPAGAGSRPVSSAPAAPLAGRARP